MIFGSLGHFALGQFTDTTVVNRTVNLSGVVGAGASGTFIPTVSPGFGGVVGTSAAGSLGPSNSNSIVGTAGASGVGSFVPSPSKTITGVAGTSAAGSLGSSLTLNIIGVAAVSSAGIVIPNVLTQSFLFGVSALGLCGGINGPGPEPNVGAAPLGASAQGIAGIFTFIVSGGGGGSSYIRPADDRLKAGLQKLEPRPKRKPPKPKPPSAPPPEIIGPPLQPAPFTPPSDVPDQGIDSLGIRAQIMQALDLTDVEGLLDDDIEDILSILDMIDAE